MCRYPNPVPKHGAVRSDSGARPCGIWTPVLGTAVAPGKPELPTAARKTHGPDPKISPGQRVLCSQLEEYSKTRQNVYLYILFKLLL